MSEINTILMKGLSLSEGISVNVRLCGSIPRGDFKSGAGAPRSVGGLTSSSDTLNVREGCKSGVSTLSTTAVCDRISDLTAQNYNMRSVLTENQPLAPLLEPPVWAVPAKGETRLEPVCEALGRQAAVDLTQRAFFRIGRSPSCDVQLLHGTSSRRHAMLFHHSNGSCYVVDCGSAHGTYVNGKRIASPVQGGLVVPHKVRRGALIRFGGPGAPCFLLKSFAFVLNDVVEPDDSESDMGELVRRNTRFNALGQTALKSLHNSLIGTMESALLVDRKRSFDSLCSSRTLDEDEPSGKRLRCSSPPLFPDEPLRLVSPDLPSILASKPRRVRFCADPPQMFYPSLVTPEELSSEEDNTSV